MILLRQLLYLERECRLLLALAFCAEWYEEIPVKGFVA